MAYSLASGATPTIGTRHVAAVGGSGHAPEIAPGAIALQRLHEARFRCCS